MARTLVSKWESEQKRMNDLMLSKLEEQYQHML